MNRKFQAAGVLAASIAIAAVSVTSASASPNRGNVKPNATGTSICTNTGIAKTGTQGLGMNGYGRGMNGNGRGMNAGAGMQGQSHLLAPMGVLTAAQKVELVSMVQEEKLAHDVYVAISAKYPALVQFSKIAKSELQHETALRSLLTRYGITDPTAGLANGKFATAAFQNLYNELVANATSTTAALAVGVRIEKLDIADLSSAISGLTAPDALQVYTNLRNASQRHLVAFAG
jgi:hypothetical protein